MRKVKSTIAAMGASLLTLLLMVTAALPASAQFTKTINGYLSVTGLDGTVSTVTSSLVVTQESTEKDENVVLLESLELDFGKAVINGFEIDDLKLEGIKYSLNGAASLDAAESIQLLSTSPANSFSFAGANVEIGISNSPASLIYLNKDEESTELNFTITFASQDITMSAVFTTLKPADFEDPNAPVAGEVTDFKGRIAATVIVKGAEKDEEVTYRQEKTISVANVDDPNASGYYTAEVTIPAISFGKIPNADGSFNSDEESDFTYEFDGFTIQEVKALRRGYVITLSAKEENIETSDSKKYTNLDFSGTIYDNGAAMFSYTITNDKGQTQTFEFDNDPGTLEVFKGKLNIALEGNDLTEEPIDANVEIITIEGEEGVTFLLPNFPLVEGDIRVDNVSVETDENGTRKFEGEVEGMTLVVPGIGKITANVNVDGTITEEGHAEMTIDVLWIDANMPIKVTFVGNLNDSTTGIVAPEAPAVMEGPAEYFNINGMRVSEGNLIPGIYIERRGNQARKILVK